MSFNEQRAVDTLPARIPSLQAQVEALNGELADPGLYARDPDRFVAKTAALGAAHSELTGGRRSVVDAEMRREEIAGV